VSAAVESGAQGVRWDLTLLAPSEEAMKERLEAVVGDAAAFVERWPAESLASIEPADLATLLGELGAIRAARTEGQYWTMMLTWTEGDNPDILDVQAWVDSRLPRLDEAIRHFELAWVAVPDESAEELANDDAVERSRHYLRGLRRFRPFMLSPAEERALSVREAGATTAWKTLRDRTLAPLLTRFDDGTGERDWPLAELEVARRSHPDREVRRRAQETANAVFEPVLPVLAHCYDSLVADRLAVDELRGHTDPLEHTNVENEVTAEVVESLIAASEAHVGIAHRWFRKKADLLGLDRLDAIDYAAPVLEAPSLGWEDGRRLVVDTFAAVTPALGSEADQFFSQPRIDAEPRRGKPSGAFCLWPSTRTTGFVFLNWTGQLRDLVMLVHELGHGTHAALAAKQQTDNSLHPGTAVAEVPSTFAEMLLVDHLLATDAQLGRAMLARWLDQAVTVAFLSPAFARFEQQAYALRSEGQALSPARLDDLSASAVGKVFADVITDEHGCGRLYWPSLPHFVHERFYTYSYAFAFLLAAGLHSRSGEPGFAERYERFLTAGGSAPPEELLAIVGTDLADPGIWDDGFVVLEGFLDRIE
jgi:oligoendopeptidase F